MNKYPKSNNILELNRAFFDIFKKISNLKNRDLQFTFGEGEPSITTCCNSLYLDTLTGDLYQWDPTTGSWVLIYTFAGGVGTPGLQQVLDQNNSATDQDIQIYGLFSHITVGTDGTPGTLGGVTIGYDTDHPYISMNSGNGTGISNIFNNLPVGLTNIEMPASSGTLALLSDIAAGGPTTINTQVDSDYTLLIGDGDNNTLIEMSSAADHILTINNAVAFPIGTVVLLARRGLGEVNVAMVGGGVLLSANSATNLTYQNSGATLLKVSATEWYLWGDIGTPATGGGGSTTIDIKAVTYQTTNYTINQATDYTVMCTTNSFQVTLPPSSVEGQIFNIKNLGVDKIITLVPDGIDTIDGAASQTINYPENMQVQNIDGGWIIL